VVVEDGRILEVGPGLDGDEAVDVDGRHLLPGLFDCHTHVTLSSVNLLGILQAPFSDRFFETVQNLAATLRTGITCVRDAAGADAGVKRAVADGLVPGPRLQISVTLLSQTGGHGDGWYPSGQTLDLWPVYPGMPDGLVDGPEAMRHGLPQPQAFQGGPRRTRFYQDRDAAEQAWQRAAQVGINQTRKELGVSDRALRTAWQRHGLGLPPRPTATPTTPVLDPAFMALNRGLLPARDRSSGELAAWVRRDEEYATLGADVVVELNGSLLS
jgi:hypothetical protein